MAFTRRDVAYLLVLAWAFAGIAIKQSATPAVTISAWIATAIVLIMALYSGIQTARRQPIPAAA
jgi:hypothetical protein